MQVELSNLEFDLIVEILQERQVALLREISKTDHFEFRRMLKTRAEILEGLLNKVGVTAHAP
jgi:hypothetical protein